MVLVEAGSVRLLTDPVFDPEGTAFHYGPITLEKTTRRAIEPAALGRIDAVLLSHDQHGDNLDEGGREYLTQVPQVLTTPVAASRLTGVRAVGLAAWETAVVTGPEGDRLTVRAVPAQHGPAGTVEATGPVTGFVLEWEGQERGVVYISGDTVRFAGTEEIVERYAPVGLALLHAGRVQLAPMGGLEFSLSAKELAAYAAQLQPAYLAPIHWEGWKHFTEGQAEVAAALAAGPQADRVCWLERGVPQTFAL